MSNEETQYLSKRLDELHDKIDSQSARIASIEVTLAEQRIHGRGAHKRIDSVETRVEKLKDNQNKALGAMAVITTGLSMLGAYLAKALFGE